MCHFSNQSLNLFITVNIIIFFSIVGKKRTRTVCLLFVYQESSKTKTK